MIRAYRSDERPRERCLNSGPDTLSLRECLALLFGSGPPKKGCLGLAEDILERAGKFEQGGPLEERAFFAFLENAASSDLSGIVGLGEAGSSRLLAAFELARRYAAFREAARLADGKTFDRDSERIPARVPSSLRCRTSEWIGFFPVFKAGGVADLCVVERGTRTHVNVDLQELFGRLLALRPDGLVLVHNHPSGDLNPSPHDYELTDEVRFISARLGLKLFAHLIVAPTGDHWIE